MIGDKGAPGFTTEQKLDMQQEAELHYAKEELRELGANARGAMEAMRARNGQRDTTADKGRANDRSQSGLIREKIAKLSKQAGRDNAHKDIMASKIKALAERFNTGRERGRDEGRGR